jgi:hypothetical protein
VGMLIEVGPLEASGWNFSRASKGSQEGSARV